MASTACGCYPLSFKASRATVFPVIYIRAALALLVEKLKWDIADLNQVNPVKEQRVDGSSDSQNYRFKLEFPIWPWGIGRDNSFDTGFFRSWNATFYSLRLIFWNKCFSVMKILISIMTSRCAVARSVTNQGSSSHPGTLQAPAAPEQIQIAICADGRIPRCRRGRTDLGHDFPRAGDYWWSNGGLYWRGRIT